MNMFATAKLVKKQIIQNYTDSLTKYIKWWANARFFFSSSTYTSYIMEIKWWKPIRKISTKADRYGIFMDTMQQQ